MTWNLTLGLSINARLARFCLQFCTAAGQRANVSDLVECVPAAVGVTLASTQA